MAHMQCSYFVSVSVFYYLYSQIYQFTNLNFELSKYSRLWPFKKKFCLRVWKGFLFFSRASAFSLKNGLNFFSFLVIYLVFWIFFKDICIAYIHIFLYYIMLYRFIIFINEFCKYILLYTCVLMYTILQS